MQEINIALLQFFNNFSANPIIAKIAPILADFPIFFLPVFFLSLWIYYSIGDDKNTQKKLALMYIFYSCVIALLISIIIQYFIHFDRPESALSSAGKLLMKHIPDASFPSDHASVSVAFLSALFFFGYKTVFYNFLPWVILMLICRVVVGVHWPFDILVGACIGVISGYISFVYITKIHSIKKINLFIMSLLSYIKL